MNIESKKISEYDNINSCLICRNEKYNIIISDFNICKLCNNNIINSKVTDLSYDYYKDKVKEAIFTKYNINI